MSVVTLRNHFERARTHLSIEGRRGVVVGSSSLFAFVLASARVAACLLNVDLIEIGGIMPRIEGSDSPIKPTTCRQRDGNVQQTKWIESVENRFWRGRAACVRAPTRAQCPPLISLNWFLTLVAFTSLGLWQIRNQTTWPQRRAVLYTRSRGCYKTNKSIFFIPSDRGPRGRIAPSPENARYLQFSRRKCDVTYDLWFWILLLVKNNSWIANCSANRERVVRAEKLKVPCDIDQIQVNILDGGRA